jgi:hypothetical protein
LQNHPPRPLDAGAPRSFVPAEKEEEDGSLLIEKIKVENFSQRE